jgi:hypothetical protein
VKRSGSNGGVGLLVRLPIPGKQVGDFVGGVIWKPGQHVSEPGLRIDVVHLAGFDQGIDCPYRKLNPVGEQRRIG